MRKASPIHYGNRGDNIGWSAGTGPVVVCIHGWGGSGAADMGPMADALVAGGYRVIAIDLTAHGKSPGRRVSFRQFINDISEFASGLDEAVYSYIGFSAGGLSMMAARAKGSLSAPKYVCISSPCAPYPPLALMQKKLRVSKPLLQRFQQQLAAEFEVPWQNITEHCFRKKPGESLQLCYDTADTLVHHSDGEKIQALWPEAQLMKTTGNKHRQMPQAQTVIANVLAFISTRD